MVVVAASKAFRMRCVVCGCDKAPADFSGAQKKRPAAKRKCASCAAANGSDAPVVRAGATSLSAACYGMDTALVEAAPATATATAPDGLAAAAVAVTCTGSDDGEADTTGMACSTCGKQLAGTTASHQTWQKCSRCKQAIYCDVDCQLRALEAGWAQTCVQ